jgi:hypothetical protein
MHSAGARALRGDDNEMSREAVLLQWERKIEAAERLDGDSRRFVRAPEPPAEATEAAAERELAQLRVAGGAPTEDAPAERAPAEDAPAHEALAEHAVPRRRFERSAPVAARRTVTITGQPTPARRRRPVVDAQLAQPDRIALWAFLLGLLLVAVAAGTAHA